VTGGESEPQSLAECSLWPHDRVIFEWCPDQSHYLKNPKNQNYSAENNSWISGTCHQEC